MPAKGFLNLEQKERLQILVRSNDSPRLREHALILLLQNDGKTYEEIASFIGCGYRTVAHWCEARRMRGSSDIRVYMATRIT